MIDIFLFNSESSNARLIVRPKFWEAIPDNGANNLLRIIGYELNPIKDSNNYLSSILSRDIGFDFTY